MLINRSLFTEFTKKSLEQKIASLEKDVSSLRVAKSQMDTSLNAKVAELEQLRERLSLSENREAELEEDLGSTKQQLNLFKGLLKEKEVELEDSKRSKVVLEKEYNDSLVMIAKDGMKKSDLKEENLILRSKLDDTMTELQTYENNREAFLVEIARYGSEMAHLKDELDVAKVSLESAKTAIDKRENRQKQQEEKHKVECQAKDEQLAAMMLRLQRTTEMFEEQIRKESLEKNKQLDDLKMRLQKAAEEYEDRYKYSVKLESKLLRMQSKVAVR